MYFILPGVVCQGKTFIVDGNIGTCVELAGVRAAIEEALSTITSYAPSSFETSRVIAWGEAIPVTEISKIETVEAELQFVSGFVDSSGVTAAQKFVTSISAFAFELTRVEASIEVRSTVGAFDRQFEVYATEKRLSGYTFEALEIKTEFSPTGRPLHVVSPAWDLLLSPFAAKFLPLSPGYVPGIAKSAVELVGVEVGYPPQPLTVGLVRQARELTKVEATELEVCSTRVSYQQSLVTNTDSRVKSALPSSELSLVEVAELLNGKTSRTTEISLLETVDRQPVYIYSSNEVILIESDCLEITATLTANLIFTIDLGQTWLNEPPLSVEEVTSIESIEKELHLLPSVSCLLPSPYAAESAITKPVF